MSLPSRSTLWTRFDSYTLRDGVIRPGEAALKKRYEPLRWPNKGGRQGKRTHYMALFDAVGDEERVLQWVSDHGLLKAPENSSDAEHGETVESIESRARKLQGVLVDVLRCKREDDQESLFVAVERLEKIAAPCRPIVMSRRGKTEIRWRVVSLLSALARMAALDLAGITGLLGACARCSALFWSPRSNALYCTTRCQQAEEKARQRHRS